MKEDRKTELITIRCTVKEKDLIKRKADERNKSVGVYVLDSSLANLERRSCKEKRRVRGMIERQNKLNEINKRVDEADFSLEEAKEIIKNLLKEEMVVWLR